jgi:hypothetical protein
MKSQLALIALLVMSTISMSGCTSSNDTKADYAGFNKEFKSYWDDVVTSTQAKNNRQFFTGYKTDEYNNLIVSTTNNWFNIESYQKQQLLTMIGQAYNSLRVKYGLREGDVILMDQVGGEICRYTVWGNIECKY